MVCIYCGSPTSVTNSRPIKRLNGVWRRRACNACGSIVTTVERADLTSSLLVRTPKGAFTPFSRDKLLISLHSSLGHRKTAPGDAGALCDTLIGRLLSRAEQAVVPADAIIEEAVAILGRFDPVAGAHYHAYHQRG